MEKLTELEIWARFAPWPGESGPTDRRVFLALVRLCLSQGKTTTGYGKRNIALCAGVSKEAVEDSLKRLKDAGRLDVAKAGDFMSRSPMLGPEDTTHIFPPLVSENIYTNPDMCMPVDALSVVWSVPRTDHGPGLAGRHGQLFDLVCVGLDTARALGGYIGSRPDSVSRVLTRLVEVGLLVKTGTAYSPTPEAGELAEQLALDLGGVEVCAHRENRYRDEEAQYAALQQVPDNQSPAMAGDWPDPFDYDGRTVHIEEPDDDERQRQEAERELYEQVGLPWYG